MAETPARYCSNCGHELSPEDQFCPNCGSAVHETATVPTPEADVTVPPPPQAAAAAAPPPQQAEGTQRSRSRRNLFLAGCLGLIGVLALLIIAIVAIVALGSGGGDEPAQKDKPPAGAPANTPESTPASKPTDAPADEDAGTITMSDVKMAADENGEQPTTVFSPNDTFYCVGYLEDAPDDTKVTAVWIASDVENVEPNSKIKQISARGGSGLFQFNLRPADTWPTGEYAVQLYLNDAKDPAKALTFEVR
jgi:hypothetical protein